jgi:hypothetical protein
MKRSDVTGQRLVAIFLMGCFLLNYPILSLFARPAVVAGVPLLFAWVFAAWAALVGLMAFVIERPRD